MTQEIDPDTTPLTEETAEAATVAAELPQRRPVLIGTFLKPEGDVALIRDSHGTLRQMKLGDEMGQTRVAAIDDGTVHLALHGEIYKLSVPG